MQEGKSDSETEDMFIVDLLEIADQNCQEVEQNFKEAFAQEEEHSHDLKRAKSETSQEAPLMLHKSFLNTKFQQLQLVVTDS